MSLWPVEKADRIEVAIASALGEQKNGHTFKSRGVREREERLAPR